MTPLRRRMIDAMVLRGFAARTQETYLSAVGLMARHHHLSPDLLSDEQVHPSSTVCAAESTVFSAKTRTWHPFLRFLVVARFDVSIVIWPS